MMLQRLLIVLLLLEQGHLPTHHSRSINVPEN